MATEILWRQTPQVTLNIHIEKATQIDISIDFAIELGQ